MRYIMFLDDERHPAFISDIPVVICRSAQAFKQTIMQIGFPEEFHMDHDLGEPMTGNDCLIWLREYILEAGLKVPEFKFHYHTQNPIGRRNMQATARDFDVIRENQE